MASSAAEIDENGLGAAGASDRFADAAIAAVHARLLTIANAVAGMPCHQGRPDPEPR